MLFRYAFPIPRHGQLIAYTLYFEGDHTPSQSELITILSNKLETAQEFAQMSGDDEGAWREVKNLTGAIYALKNIKSPNLPRLPTNGSNAISVLCNTQIESSAIRISLIQPTRLSPTRLRLVREG